MPVGQKVTVKVSLPAAAMLVLAGPITTKSPGLAPVTSTTGAPVRLSALPPRFWSPAGHIGARAADVHAAEGKGVSGKIINHAHLEIDVRRRGGAGAAES